MMPAKPPGEIQWYLAKYVPDTMRNEPRNIGVLLRTMREPLRYRFITQAPDFVSDPETYRAWLRYWTETIEKHREKCLHWITKRRAGDNYYVEFAGARIVGGDVDFEALYARLVDDSDLDGEVETEVEPDKAPGWWKK